MRNKFLVLAALVSMTTVSTRGALFNYSYVFGTGYTVTGSLEGVQNGDFVDNVHNVTVVFDGTPMIGTVYTGKYVFPHIPVNGPVVSFDASKNNFFFANHDAVGGDYANGNGEGFYLVARNDDPEIPPQARVYLGQIFDARDANINASKWSLTAVPVPEPSTFISGLSALGMLGVFGWRNRRSR